VLTNKVREIQRNTKKIGQPKLGGGLLEIMWKKVALNQKIIFA
jgi:hypothetical protein